MSEVRTIQKFVDLLKLEQTALSAGNTDALPEYADQKNLLAIQLSNLAEQRNILLSAQGFKSDRAGVESWISKHTKERSAGATWAQILALASEARELNRINGELIQLRMQYNARALEALMGANKSLDLYGPNGQSTSLGSRRIHDAV